MKSNQRGEDYEATDAEEFYFDKFRELKSIDLNSMN